jgi:hypothetical protein
MGKPIFLMLCFKMLKNVPYLRIGSDYLHSQFVRLDMLQVDGPLFHQMLVHLLAVLARPCQPGRHGALIVAKGSNDSLEGTAMAQQRETERHHVGHRLQATDGPALGGCGRLETVLAPIALLHVALRGDVPLP